MKIIKYYNKIFIKSNIINMMLKHKRISYYLCSLINYVQIPFFH